MKTYNMKTFIVLIPLENNRNARAQCEDIENSHFEVESKTNCETVTAYNVKTEIDNIINDKKVQVEVYPITDFMDDFNNQEIYADNYFMSYVTATIKN